MRKDQEKAGYFSELLYNALVLSTDDFIYVCDPQTNTFRYPKAWGSNNKSFAVLEKDCTPGGLGTFL
mgnify:CR=1 FL=1